MGVVVIKIKIMPESPEIELAEIEKDVGKFMEKNNVKNPQFEIQPIAFGLKALLVMFGWPEEKEFEGFEKDLQKIKGVGSVDIIDMRRAVG